MFGTNTVYSSEELFFLRCVFDEAVSTLALEKRTSEVKSKIAKRIMHCAATGERDRIELRIAGLKDFSDVSERA